MTIKTVTLISSLLAAAVVGQAQPISAPAAQQLPVAASAVPAPTPDEKNAQIASDFRSLSRIATLAKDLGDTRQVMLAMIDTDIEMLREKRADDTFKWASLQRVEASRVKDEKAIERVQSEKELREVMVTAPYAYRLEVTVPPKRNLVSSNNRVYVRNVLVDLTGFDGKTTHHEIPVNAWVNPGDSNGVALPAIGKSVKATAELGVESGDKRAVAQVALVQAKLVDDPNSPYYPAVRRLLQIRDLTAADNINRGQVKNTVDEALLSLPGELEKRTAEQMAAEARRKELATTGQMAHAIALGDATPDVVAAIQEALRLLSGTLQDQTDGRAKLQSLVDTLQPKPVAPAPPVTK